jgi:hypothetical protein
MSSRVVAYPECGTRSCGGRADPDALHTAHHDDLLATANPADLLDDTDGADGAVTPVAPGNQQHARVVRVRLRGSDTRTRW